MTSSEILIIALATLLGPVLAVQAQKFIERASEARRRKSWIFHTLMTTRATRLSVDHVAALNSIDLTFTGRRGRKVVDAWRLYADALNEPVGDSEAAQTAWHDRRESLFTELMHELSKALGYDFNRVQLRRGIYYPRGLGDLEEAQRRLLNSAVKVLQGEQAITMDIASLPVTPEAAALNAAVQQALLNCLTGTGQLQVTLKPDRNQ